MTNKEKIKKWYDDSMLKFGIEYHLKAISEMGMFYYYKQVNIAGKILVYPFVFLWFLYMVLFNITIFLIGCLFYMFGLIVIGIGLGFEFIFLKKMPEEKEQQEEIKGNRPPTND